MQFARKRGFTFVEIVIVIFVLTVGVTWMIFALNKGMTFIQTTRQRVVAVNLAREWMEWVYNIRDTNRKRWAWKKDECRLKVDPLDVGDNDICDDDPWMQSGFYILEQKKIAGQKYFILSGVFDDVLDFDDGVSSWEFIYSLCQSGTIWSTCPWMEPISNEWKYWRQIYIKGLFLKDIDVNWWDFVDCENWEDGTVWCSDSRAKELRFCSRVGFQWEWFGIVELCGVMTNFLE